MIHILNLRVLISTYTFYFSGVIYEKLALGSLCYDVKHEVKSSQECELAGESLGLRWGEAWNGTSDFPSCLHAEDGRNLVYFNLSPNPGRTNVTSKFAAICRKGTIP